MTSLIEEEKRLIKVEQETQKIAKATERLLQNNLEDEDDAELSKLILENTKLKHRLSILNQAIVEEKRSKLKNADYDGIVSLQDTISSLFTAAIRSAYPDLDVTAVIATGTNAKFGDYQCNNAMSISKMLKAKGTNAAPKDIALKIVQHLSESPFVNNTEVSPAGFINIFINKQYAEHAIVHILKNDALLRDKKVLNIVVDFSAPNIAKEMHVGHLRSTIIGESICRFLESLGHKVLRLNHIGDWGTQFGMLIAHLESVYPNYAQVSPDISDLQKFYKESKVRFDSDEQFKKIAYDRVVKLQNGDAACRNAWNLICDVTRKDISQIYERLGISIIERGESFYQSRMEDIVRELKERQFLEEDDGRYIMWGGEPGNGIPLTVIKSDGGFTYDTSDMATIKQRIVEEKADWIIYVTDAGQATHFKTIFACAERAGILDRSKVRIDHVGFGVVLGEDGKKFKTRSGDTVKLSLLLDEGLTRAMAKLVEKGRHEVLTPAELKAAQESVAYGCIKYSDLSHNSNNEYIFSFDRMLEDKGNTAVYLLYAYTRIKSIARNCGGDFVNNLPKVIENNIISLDHEKEWKLAKILIKYPDVIAKISNDLCLHYLCEYVYELSAGFTEFYDNCYCIEKDQDGKIVKINAGRVLLAEATAKILEKCFHILGLQPVDKI